MRTAALLVASFGLTFAVACNPTIKAVCATDSDCPEGLSCEEGLCLVPSHEETDGGTRFDGGAEVCEPACSDGTICVAGKCRSDDEPFVIITSPEGNNTYSGGALAVTVKAFSPNGLTRLEVRLNSPAATLQTVSAAPTGNPDEYGAVMDLADPAIADGDYSLVAVLFSNEDRKNSEPVMIRVVKSGPSIRIMPPVYPSRPSGHPSTGAFLRDELVIIQAIISDDVAGLSTTPPQLLIPGMFPVPGIEVAPRTFRFELSGRSPALPQVQANISFVITAKNTAGVETSESGSFRLSRWKWTWEKQRNLPIRSAPTLTRGLIVLGSEDNFVYALRPQDGSVAWEYNAGSPIVGHVVAGDSRVYAATKEGRIYALDPVDIAINDNQRRLWRCPDAAGGWGQPALYEFRTGAALARLPVSGSNAALEETLVTFTANGRIRLLRQSAFPQPWGFSSGCQWDGPNNNWPTFNANDAVVPTLVQSGNEVRIFIGDMGGVVRRLTVKLTSGGTGQQQVFQMSQDWTSNIGGPVHASMPYGAFGGGNGVLAMREDSSSFGFELGGAEFWPRGPRVLPGQSRVPSVVGAGAAYVVDMNGNMSSLSLADGQPNGTSAFLGSPNTKDANAGPLLASDGRVYFASGTKLQAVAVSGAAEWEFEPASAGSDAVYLDYATPAMGCDGTLYVVGSTAKRGFVHALITDSTEGLASSAWPRPNHDSKNTSNANTPLSTSGTCTD